MGKHGPLYTLWPKQQDILAFVLGNPGCTVAEVGDCLGLENYEVRAGIAQLIEYGYVEKRRVLRRVYSEDLAWKRRWHKVLTLQPRED